ncbi:cell division protein ZapA [Legionella quinlivanii]|uniref:Cell division protein ZapA n=1 Tax=Legionella quinlivanii TaxID=45073 RepID=A0A0W0Y5Y5_9GAMM|nr:cell division protein ZapA [Legionella quinlivanii]KTD52066.1 cell division protein ZapA [Legionella quinlivanii]MCW8452330.1 cell division protein ZapA [Legionella quinlivanii]RAP37352.1 cell division protein ZapA [Legionella quinlivanii]SEF89113.1 cell division protein ZapA [Legionella quinlivanii DSM 21216]STY12438.1 cell division protein ZapA [Legionella quinlivanii]
MTTSKACSIRLLNKTYEIKCPDHEVDNLQRAGQKLNEQLLANKKKFRQLDEFQNLLLAAIHISHELITCQRQQEQQRHQVTQFINSLETRINQVVNGNPELDPQTD